MSDRAEVLRLLFAAVDALNSRLPVAQRLERDEAAPIAGDSAAIESLEYVNLVLDYECRLGAAFGVAVPLAESLVRDESSGPPATLGALADLGATILAECRR